MLSTLLNDYRNTTTAHVKDKRGSRCAKKPILVLDCQSEQAHMITLYRDLEVALWLF